MDEKKLTDYSENDKKLFINLGEPYKKIIMPESSKRILQEIMNKRKDVTKVVAKGNHDGKECE